MRDAREIFSLANKISYVCSLSLLLALAPGFLSSITSFLELFLSVVNLTRYPVRAGLTSLLCNRLEVSSDIVLTRNLWLEICTLSLGIDVSSRVHRQTIVLLFITAKDLLQSCLSGGRGRVEGMYVHKKACPVHWLPPGLLQPVCHIHEVLVHLLYER